MQMHNFGLLNMQILMVLARTYIVSGKRVRSEITILMLSQAAFRRTILASSSTSRKSTPELLLQFRSYLSEQIRLRFLNSTEVTHPLHPLPSSLRISSTLVLSLSQSRRVASNRFSIDRSFVIRHKSNYDCRPALFSISARIQWRVVLIGKFRPERIFKVA